jgi:transcriptional regulator GlxA family with amidase domain
VFQGRAADPPVERPVLQEPDRRKQSDQDEECDKGENRQEDVHVSTVGDPRHESQWQHCHQSSNYCQTGDMPNNVVAVLLNGVHPFELGVVCEVFGLDRSDEGLPVYDFAVVSAEGPVLTTHAGFTVGGLHGLERLEEADLITVPAGTSYATRTYPPELLAALRRAVDRGARVMSVCSGVFVLGAAGLLDGRRCACHWQHADAVERAYPKADVRSDVLYVEDGPIITSAGTAAGIDACLHVVRQDHGPEVANAIARRMVVPPHRDGGQAQFIARPLPKSPCDTVGETLAWMERNLDSELTVEQLAARAHMSPRTFARRFQQETGTTPYRWLLRQRVLLAQQLLEATDETVDSVAGRAGFGNAAGLRHHFLRTLGTTPHAYRRTFRGPARVQV